MGFRNIMIESPAHISVKNSQLLVRTDREHSVPIEDISALLLENTQSTISTAALSRLGQCGCAVYVCDERHMPCAVLTPFFQHSRELTVIQNQLKMTAAQKKRLWQAVIKQKIQNQSLCLRISGNETAADELLRMAGQVRSGDPENIEAVAAQKYFPALFGDGFSRNEDNGINSGLNYGYAILRGSISRHLAAYGFLPAVGLHHCNALNAFNLADDLIEPFRPVIDLLVFQKMSIEDGLSPEKKRMIFNCLNFDIYSGGQHHSVGYAIERVVRSLSSAAASGTVTLCLPELLPTAMHCYE